MPVRSPRGETTQLILSDLQASAAAVAKVSREIDEMAAGSRIAIAESRALLAYADAILARPL